jgi:hypothetical protein
LAILYSTVDGAILAVSISSMFFSFYRFQTEINYANLVKLIDLRAKGSGVAAKEGVEKGRMR